MVITSAYQNTGGLPARAKVLPNVCRLAVLVMVMMIAMTEVMKVVFALLL